MPTDGLLLTGITGIWTGVGTLTFTQAWKRDSLVVGTGNQYTYQFPDDFADMTFVVTATDSLGQSTTVSSPPLQAITALNFEDVNALHFFLNTTYPTEFLTVADAATLTGLTGTLATPGYWG